MPRDATAHRSVLERIPAAHLSSWTPKSRHASGWDLPWPLAANPVLACGFRLNPAQAPPEAQPALARLKLRAVRSKRLTDWQQLSIDQVVEASRFYLEKRIGLVSDDVLQGRTG